MNQLRIFSLLILTLFAYGCFSASPPTRTFILSAADLQVGDNTVKVRIGRIVLPDYLKRWEIITLVNEREVRINDFAQWGELLEDGVQRILTENFRQVLGLERVFGLSSADEADCWRLDYEFLALAGNEKGVLVVKAICRACRGDSKKLFTIAFEVPCVAAKSEEQLVKAHEVGLGRLVLETLSCLQTADEQKRHFANPPLN
jgi:uncharacterized lipoprotein YmbA